MTTSHIKSKSKLNLPFLSQTDLLEIHKSLRDPVDYRKSGLSLNHIIGCPNDCLYCVRHIFRANFLRQPHAILSDNEAVRLLIKNCYFKANVTPLQLLNRATDPFLPAVKEHTFAVLRTLDSEGFQNVVTVITRCSVTEEDCCRLNSMKNIRVALFVSYSGIDDKRIERFDNSVSAKSLKIAFVNKQKYRVILYWRPIIQGVNDGNRQLSSVITLGKYADAIVFTGLIYRSQIKRNFEQENIETPYNSTARRKTLPHETEVKILNAYKEQGITTTPLFRKTSCAVSYVFGIPDYNAHYCIDEICDICPETQVKICKHAYKIPTSEDIMNNLSLIGKESTPFNVTTDAIFIEIGDQDRHFLQHQLSFQVQNPKLPHIRGHHGRSNIGWE